jgi:hypothetical protein
VIIVRLSGGVGNQLFQFATALSISRKNNFPLLIDKSSFHEFSTRDYLLSNLIVNLPLVDKELVKSLVEPRNWFIKQLLKIFKRKTILHVEEKKLGYDLEIAALNFSCYLKGSFISYKYFSDINNALIDSIIFDEEIQSYVFSKFNVDSKDNLVCVNVRRGDFLTDQNLNVCNISYYAKAISHARLNLDAPKFLFFSDDIIWVKENFINKDFFYWDDKNENVLQSLFAMTLCNHHIISNSSFGWWGAWLNNKNEKKVFCPSTVLNDNTFPVDDYYPETWIKIDP